MCKPSVCKPMGACARTRNERRIASFALTVWIGTTPSTDPRAQGFQGEGPLGNDVFLPVSESAAKELAAGDEALLKKDGEVAGNRAAAFEAWRRALAGTKNGDCAAMMSGPGIGGSGISRGTESVECAILRRLRAAGAEAASAWRARFETVAGAALGSAGADAAALARVERGFPLTRAAARSALALADLAHESGDPISAGTWLDRARANADPGDADLEAAIDRRASASRPPPPEDFGAPWRGAGHLAIEAQVALEGSEPVRRGIDPGIAFLRDGRVCVQCAGSLHLVAVDGRARSFELLEIARAHGWSWLSPFAEKGERWPLRPSSDGRWIALVAGRASETQGNALLLFDASPDRAEPRLAWGYSDTGFSGQDGSSRKIDELLGPGLWEFEPGPRIVGGAVFVQAHQWTAEAGERPSVDERAVRAWCLALDLESGLPRWKCMLAVGASGQGRRQGARGFARPAQPLAVLGGRILAGTGIGAGSRIDLCDGRVVATWKFRRAPEGAKTWSLCPPLGVAAPLVPGQGPGGGGQEGAVIVWAPPDSDRMYFLRPDADATAQGAFVLQPREIGDDVVPIDADRDRVILLSGDGGRTTLARLSPASSARVDSVELPLGERFSPCGLASASRAIVASDRRAYLFDVGRDLYLLDTVRLSGREESPEGEMAARGERVYVAGERRLWILRAR